MGNKSSYSKDDYYMHVQLIGLNLENFYQEIKKVNPQKKIKEFWDFTFNNNPESLEKEINNYFDKLKSNYDNQITDEIRETLIFKIDNFSPEIENGKEIPSKSKILKSPEVDIILKRMNALYQTHYMPFVLLLSTDENRLKLEINEKEYKYLDPRLIIPSYYNEDPSYIELIIDQILLRFCSIHNELGDRFCIKDEKGNEYNYDLIPKYFPFNINIACIGRFGQGKSTGVNKLLREYKAKESSKGSSQTKQLTYYQSSEQPVRILDIPGFENKQSVEDAVIKLKSCGEKINKIKDNLHIILYFLNYVEERKFSKEEKPLLEEIVNHQNSRIIYVITHSNQDDDPIEKTEFINEINIGIFSILDKNDEKNKMLKANSENVVFVNFKVDRKTKFKPFGEDILFKKIHDFFIETDDYKNSLKSLTPEIIKNDAEKLREEAKSALFYHKIGGGIIGLIPGLDFLVQNYVIKKDAIKKIGDIFGIDVKLIDKDSNIKKTKKLPKYITSEIDAEVFEAVYEKDLMKEQKNDNLKNALKAAGEAGIYYGGKKACEGILYLNKVKSLATAATSFAEHFSSIAQVATEKANSVSFFCRLFTNSYQTATKTAAGAKGVSETFSQIAVSYSNKASEGVLLTARGSSIAILGCLVGVALGGYFTHRFCEDLIDKFTQFYKNNAQEISNSYKQAVEYFENNAKVIRESYNKSSK